MGHQHMLQLNGGESKELLPSCAPSTFKHCRSFDPNQELSRAPDRKKHKIPRGKVHSNLKEKGQIQTVKTINPNQAKNAITTASFSMFATWEYLETGQDNQLLR